jgi:hypothetical protein
MTIVYFALLDVLIWAFSGALVSVLCRLPADGLLSRQWLIDAFARLVVRTLVGIAGSAFLPAMGLVAMDLHAITSVPRWALAFAVASSGFMFGRSSWVIPQLSASVNLLR